MVQEKLVKTHLKILAQNNDQTPKFIGCQKLAVGVLSGLSVDRPTVIFQTVVLAQWPSTLVLMMINTHVVMFTNILVFLSFRSLTGY